MRPNPVFRAPAILASLTAAAFILGCQEMPTDAPVEDAAPAFAKPGACPGHPSCKDDGDDGDGGDGGGGDAALTLAFTGGLTGGDQEVGVKKDNKRSLDVNNAAYTIELNLADTRATAAGDRNADGTIRANPTCTWDVPAGAEGLTDDLVAALDGGNVDREVGLLVDKDAALEGVPSNDNFVRIAAHSLSPDPTVFIGRNGGPAFLTFTYGGDAASINDRGATRAFDGRGGLVRVVQRFDEDGDGELESNEPIVSVTCDLEDSFTATVAPL